MTSPLYTVFNKANLPAMFNLFITALFIGILTQFLHIKLNENVSPTEPFTDVDVSYIPQRDAPIEQYILRDQDHREEFLIAPGAPSEMSLRLVPTRSARVQVNIKPIYNFSRCNPEQINQINLRISSRSLIDKTITLIDKQTTITPIELHVGDRLQFIIAGSNTRCAKALITFTKKNEIPNYVLGFFVFWVLAALAISCLNSNPIFALLGAGFNFTLIGANLTLATATLNALTTATFISVGFTGLLMMCSGLPLWRWIKVLFCAAIFILAFTLPLSFLGYDFTFNSPGDRDAVHSLLQSNLRQGLEFWRAFGGWKYSLVLAVLFILLIIVLYHLNNSTLKKKTTFFLGLLLALISIAQWPNVTDETPIILTTKEAITKYFHEFELFREMRDERQATLNEIGATATAKNQTLVVILGESASKYHMSSYGYPRTTTPHTDQLIKNGEMIRFDAAYSNHTLSNQTISRALTRASNYNNEYWIQSPSVINLAHAADIRTSWVSNKPMYGAFDSHMSVIGTEAQSVTYINTRVGIQKIPNQHDADMLPLVKQAIDQKDGNQVVFMHLQGSHAFYCDRTPDDFKLFNEKPQRHVFGELSEIILERYWSLNCYDDSIRYTDEIIADVIDYVKTDTAPAAVLYMPDHGENAAERKGHNPAIFDFQMSDIPMFFWANSEWKKQNSKKWENMLQNRQKVFTNDHAYEFISGLNGIESELLDQTNNLASSTYTEVSKPTTLHGTEPLDSIENPYFWQQKNITKLNSMAKLNSIVAQSSNTLAKIGQLRSSGIQSVEIIARFMNGQFMVGTDNKAMSDQNLEDFLGQLDLSSLTTLRLNLVDLHATEQKAVLARLQYLNEKFSIKPKTQIVVSNLSNSITDFYKAGFRVLYKPDNIINYSKLSMINPTGLVLNPQQYIELNKELISEKDYSIHIALTEDISLGSHDFLQQVTNLGYLEDQSISSLAVHTWSHYDL